MIDSDQAERLTGAPVHGSDGERIGTVDQVFVDDTGTPTWAVVRTGMFGLGESYVPLRDASYADRAVHVPYDKSTVKGAPSVAAEGDLSSADQILLNEHYGTVSAAGAGYGADPAAYGSTESTGYGGADEPAYGATDEPTYGAADSAGYGGADSAGYGSADEPAYGALEDDPEARAYADSDVADADRADGGSDQSYAAGGSDAAYAGAAGYAAGSADSSDHRSAGGSAGDEPPTALGFSELVEQSREEAEQESAEAGGPDRSEEVLTRHEERLNVQTESEETGRVRVTKHVVTEEQTVTVPVTREEIRIEREPISAEEAASAGGEAVAEDEVEVVLHAERPVVTVESEPVERVRLVVDRVTDEETITRDVRKEEIEVDDSSPERRGD